MKTELEGVRAYWRQDLMASIVVFLVALPLCMGIAIASGVPPAAGLITGIIGGLIVGFLAGAPMQVSGPAAGLSVIVWELVNEHGLGTLGVIIAIAGLAQIGAGILRLGQWFRAVSPAVIHGMLAGIGVLILASQFHVMVDDRPQGSGLTNLLYIPAAILKGFVPADGSPHFHAAMIGVLTLVVMVAWRWAPRRLRVLPAPLIAVVVATVVAALMGLELKRVAVPDNLLDAVTFVGSSGWPPFNWTLVAEGLALAFVASAETLLCATAVDKMHDGPRTNYNRELMAQGVGNLACGVLGALPMTGVIVRSSANIDAGAKTRASAVWHGVWLLLFVVALPFVLQTIPVAALAAILVFTGYKLVNVAAIRKLATYGKGELVIYFVTLATIVAVDLLSGVILGIALSLGKLLYRFTHLDIDVQPRSPDGVIDVHVRGSATVVRLPMLAARLEALPPGSEVHVHLEELDYIDHACLELLANWEKQHAIVGGKLFVDWQGLEARFRTTNVAKPRATQVSAL
ncbi:MAG: solute carrier family 23 protein [Planctomycetota bacterium]